MGLGIGLVCRPGDLTSNCTLKSLQSSFQAAVFFNKTVIRLSQYDAVA
jgi:hypothetical protein